MKNFLSLFFREASSVIIIYCDQKNSFSFKKWEIKLITGVREVRIIKRRRWPRRAFKFQTLTATVVLTLTLFSFSNAEMKNTFFVNNFNAKEWVREKKVCHAIYAFLVRLNLVAFFRACVIKNGIGNQIFKI